MSIQDHSCAFKKNIVQSAAERWKSMSTHRSKVETAIAKGEISKIESPARMASRVNHALGVVKKRLGNRADNFMSSEARAVINSGGVSTATVTNQLLERIIGEARDLLQIDFFARGQAVSRRVGRIVTRLPQSRLTYGTGFLIAPGIALTNWHVLETEDDAVRSELQLDYQPGMPVQSFTLDPTRLFLNNEALDFAIVAVKPKSRSGILLSTYGWCPLIGTEGKISIGEPINIIQHPLGEMKQVAFRSNKLVDLDSKQKYFAYYEADTEPGSSGSPAFNDQWEVVALHHSGVPATNAKGEWLNKDGSVYVEGDDPSKINWIANEGIRISALINHLKSLSLSGEKNSLVQQIIAGTDPTDSPIHTLGESVKQNSRPSAFVPQQNALPEKAQSEPHSHPTGNILNFYGNTNVFLGAANVPSTASETREAIPGRAKHTPVNLAFEKITPDPDYTNRPGYDSEFLEFQVTLPQPVGTLRDQALKIKDAEPESPFELKYFKYSVIMHSTRKLAIISAVNLDPTAPSKHPRDKDGDKWFYDPRIGKEYQAGEDLYASNPLDRGHLARRDDAAWGDTPEEAKLSNDDTYHFTNCAPQHEIYNQAGLATKKGLKLWGNIENHISAEGTAHQRRVTLLNGPLFNANDRIYRGVQLPKQYWKVVLFSGDDGSPKGAAFLLSQESLISAMPKNEEFSFEDYKIYQLPINQLASKTSLDFSQISPFDTMGGDDPTKEGLMGPTTISSVSEIIL